MAAGGPGHRHDARHHEQDGGGGQVSVLRPRRQVRPGRQLGAHTAEGGPVPGRGGLPRPRVAGADHLPPHLHAPPPPRAGQGGATVRVPTDQILQVHCCHTFHREEVRTGEL